MIVRAISGKRLKWRTARPRIDVENVARDGLNALGELVAVGGFSAQELENDEVERALEQGRRFRSHDHH